MACVPARYPDSSNSRLRRFASSVAAAKRRENCSHAVGGDAPAGPAGWSEEPPHEEGDERERDTSLMRKARQREQRHGQSLPPAALPFDTRAPGRRDRGQRAEVSERTEHPGDGGEPDDRLRVGGLEREQQRGQRGRSEIAEQPRAEHEHQRDVRQVDGEEQEVVAGQGEAAGARRCRKPQVCRRTIETIAAGDILQASPGEGVAAAEPLEVVGSDVGAGESGGKVEGGRAHEDRGKGQPVARRHQYRWCRPLKGRPTTC